MLITKPHWLRVMYMRAKPLLKQKMLRMNSALQRIGLEHSRSFIETWDGWSLMLNATRLHSRNINLTSWIRSLRIQTMSLTNAWTSSLLVSISSRKDIYEHCILNLSKQSLNFSLRVMIRWPRSIWMNKRSFPERINLHWHSCWVALSWQRCYSCSLSWMRWNFIKLSMPLLLLHWLKMIKSGTPYRLLIQCIASPLCWSS